MHRFVRSQTGGHFGQVFAAESGDHAQVRIDGTQLKPRRQVQHVGLVAQGVCLQRLGIVLQLLLHHGHAAHFLDRGNQGIAVCLVVSLELHRHVQHAFLQQPATGTQLIGVDGFVLQAQGHIENTHIFAGITRHALCHGVLAREQGHSHCRQGTGAAHEGAARRSQWGARECLNDGLHGEFL